MMSTPTTTSFAPAPHEPLSAVFGGASLPRGLREHAEAMSWGAFAATYSPLSGPLRLGHWECLDADKRGPQPRTFHGSFAIGDRLEHATVSASGPLAALISMLYQVGVPMEMSSFHQLACGDHTATFIHGSDGEHLEWGLGWSDDKTDSALRAVIACANRLMSMTWYAEIDTQTRQYIWRRRGRRSR